MSDEDVVVATLRDKVDSFVRDREWEQFHTPTDFAAAISIEAAELLEVFLWKRQAAPEDLPRAREDLADILILCLSFAIRLNIDVSEAVLDKLHMNSAKYPADVVKGKPHKYTHYS